MFTITSKQLVKQQLTVSSKLTTTILSLLHSSSKSPLSTDSIPRLSELPSLKPKPLNSNSKLTQQEIIKINLLIPRLCLSNNLNTAINLTLTALSTNPPRKSLSFSILTHSLTSQPDLVLPISLLTKLLNQTPQHLNSVTTLLISSYLKKGRPKDALKVYKWVKRQELQCKFDPFVYGALIHGLCEKRFNLEALVVLREMIRNSFVPGEKLRMRVYRSLLREARVVEAKNLVDALSVNDFNNVLGLLDHMVSNWIE